MNILHIISGGEVGGSKTLLLTLSQSLKFSHVKSIIVCFIEGELYRDGINMGLDIRLVKQRSRFDLSVISAIKAICLQEEIDIVNCHGGRANFVGVLLKLRYEAKYVSTIHSDYREDYRGNKAKTLIFSNMNRVCLKFFHHYIAVTDTFKDMLAERGYKQDRIHVVYNGIQFPTEPPEFVRREVIMDYGLMGTSHFVTIVGRLHPVKGHRVFLDACKEVLEQFEDVTFIIAGDGELKGELIQYAVELGIQNDVYFAGFRKPDEFYAISDFSVLASYTESFPLVLLESAAFEKTVVSTDIGGVSRLIEDGVNGFLVPPGDASAMAARMLELLRDRRKAREFGTKLGQKAREEFSIQKVTETYIKIYKEIDGGFIYGN